MSCYHFDMYMSKPVKYQSFLGLLLFGILVSATWSNTAAVYAQQSIAIFTICVPDTSKYCTRSKNYLTH